MRRLKGWFPAPPVLFFILLFAGSCTDPETHTLFDPNITDPLPPSITSISPSGSAVAGMDSIVVVGQNFSAIPDENTLYFNSVRSTVLSATPTRLVTIAPSEAVDTGIAVRISVFGALDFSNSVPYALQSGVELFGDLAPATNLTPAELVSSMTIDPSGNLALAFTYGATDGGIMTFSPAGVRTDYAPATPGVISWTGLKFGAGGHLFAARNFRALYRFVPGGGASGPLWMTFPFGVKIADMDFDTDGMLWCVGDNVSIYRVAPDKSITTYAFDGNITSARVEGSYLYFAADTSDGAKVWRAPISAGGLGTPEVYFDFSAMFPGNTANAITFSSTGSLVIGTGPPFGIVFVEPDKSVSAPFGFYQQFFGTGVTKLAWSSTEYLYAGTDEGDLIRFMVRGGSGAPYNGNTQ